MTKAASIITAREIKVAMKDMGPRDRVAGVESPGDRHAITGAFFCSAITNLADRDPQQPNKAHAISATVQKQLSATVIFLQIRTLQFPSFDRNVGIRTLPHRPGWNLP
jgi:hypothetical protein